MEEKKQPQRKSKRIYWITFPVFLILGIYFLGPEPDRPVLDQAMPVVPQSPAALEKYIADNERKHKLRPDNEARIVWADSAKRKTAYSIVYLHGFSASQKEGDPTHLQFAKTFGCNLYLARMADHGVDTAEALLYFTGDRWWKSAQEALAIGKAIGDKVIIMSTSSGGTMALILASDYPDDVAGLINLSPNIHLFDSRSWLLSVPWGLQIARMILGGKYNEIKFDSPAQVDYWNSKYRIEALTQLEEMLETTMNKETFEKVKQPSLTMYYFKSETEQDPSVSVSAMLTMNAQLGTPDSLKVTVPVPNAGAHVIGSSLVSKDIITVQQEAEKFAIGKLHLKKVN